MVTTTTAITIDSNTMTPKTTLIITSMQTMIVVYILCLCYVPALMAHNVDIPLHHCVHQM